MTRINCIPPEDLTDQHLLAEYRELPRVRHIKPRQHDYDHYRLGSGHVIFFCDKGKWLEQRHKNLIDEMDARGFAVNLPPLKLEWQPEFMNDWEPEDYEQKINRERIDQRISDSKRPHTYYGRALYGLR